MYFAADGLLSGIGDLARSLSPSVGAFLSIFARQLINRSTEPLGRCHPMGRLCHACCIQRRWQHCLLFLFFFNNVRQLRLSKLTEIVIKICKQGFFQNYFLNDSLQFSLLKTSPGVFVMGPIFNFHSQIHENGNVREKENQQKRCGVGVFCMADEMKGRGKKCLD